MKKSLRILNLDDSQMQKKNVSMFARYYAPQPNCRKQLEERLLSEDGGQ